ncbi:MAG: beta-lactamase hydrolase domain-containing protein [Gemmatimonadales bacterium]
MPDLLAALHDLPNAVEAIEGWVTGGQPTVEHLAAFKAAGGEVVVDNRDPMEPRPLDEPAAVRAAGLEYVNIPIVHGAVTPATLERMHDTLRRIAGKKALLHCSSGNRTAGAMIPYLMVDAGMAEQEAVDTAMRMGLRSAELMEMAVDYARRPGA